MPSRVAQEALLGWVPFDVDRDAVASLDLEEVAGTDPGVGEGHALGAVGVPGEGRGSSLSSVDGSAGVEGVPGLGVVAMRDAL